MNKLINISFGKPLINHKEIDAVKKVLKSGIYVHGKKTIEFENNFKKFTKSKYAVAVSSCTAGMHLTYFSLGITKGDEVIVPAQTHTATAHAVELAGAKPIFIDADITTGNINIELIEKKITKNTKAISVVHFLGIPVEMDKIIKIAKKYNLKIIEDCALSLGAHYKKKHTGNFGTVGVFSFYPVKHITTAEGGMIVTNDRFLYKKLILNRALGIDKNFNERKTPGLYDAIRLGFNYRMSEIHAAIGIEQLKKINFFLKRREYNFNYLLSLLNKIKGIFVLNSINKECKSSFYALNIVLEKRFLNKKISILKKLKEKKIGFSIYYPQPVPRMTYYKNKYGYNENLFKNSEIISTNSISIPVGPHISKKEIKAVRNFLKKTLLEVL